MKEFDFIEFNSNIQKDFVDAQIIVDKLQDYYEIGYRDEDKELSELRLSEILNQLKLKFYFTYEFLGLEKMESSLKSELNKYEGKFEKLSFIPYVDVAYSPILWIFQNHLNAITCHIKIEGENKFENTNSQNLLEQILRGTPKILSDRKIEPKNETEVRNEVYKILIHVFPDTVREIPIAKVSKTYKPDIGIKNIKSAIEYKFIDSENEAKVAIGGIFEDIQGYEGSEDWTNFYAVFYMTDNFMTQDQVQAEFKLSNVPFHWKPLVVFGKGKRVKK